jgi:hypothetical protein
VAFEPGRAGDFTYPIYAIFVVNRQASRELGPSACAISFSAAKKAGEGEHRNATSFFDVKKFCEPGEHRKICGTDLFCCWEPVLVEFVRCMGAAHRGGLRFWQEGERLNRGRSSPER